MEAEDHNKNDAYNTYDFNNENQDSELNEENEESLFSPGNSPSDFNTKQENPIEDFMENKINIENKSIEDEKPNNVNAGFKNKEHQPMDVANKEKKKSDILNCVYNEKKEMENANVYLKFGENNQDCCIIIKKKVFENYNEDKFNFDLMKRKINRDNGI